jgi:peroxidase
MWSRKGKITYQDYKYLLQVQSFAQLGEVFGSPEIAAKFSQTYNSIEDIDLFVGATAERPMHGAVVGPTFACIIAAQFQKVIHKLNVANVTADPTG